MAKSKPKSKTAKKVVPAPKKKVAKKAAPAPKKKVASKKESAGEPVDAKKTAFVRGVHQLMIDHGLDKEFTPMVKLVAADDSDDVCKECPPERRIIRLKNGHMVCVGCADE
jgi:hypothetical protein